MLSRAKSMEPNKSDDRLCQDVRLSAVAMAVAAMDAYFCDAYVDCLTSVLRAYTKGNWNGDLPIAYAKRELPAGEVLDSSRQDRPLWAIRMATRKIMERDNMLMVSEIKKHFNGILPDSHKLWVGLVDKLISYNRKLLTGVNKPQVSSLSGSKLGDAKKKATSIFQDRIKETVQIRHDWIHNCGRPKSAIRKMNHKEAETRMNEIEILITEFDNHIQQQRLA